MFILFLLALAAAAIWAAGVYAFPFRGCRKCGGTGRKVRRLNRGHFDLCRRCTGTGRVQRPGSRLVHRAVLAGRAEMARQRQQRAGRKTANRTVPPGRAVPGRDRH
jgi:DnaJ-class molecular chaperone